ncbi:MAG: phospholipase, partial [Marivirga sp.]|nr:phospholipase [Marivirga sp.]
MKPVSLNHAAGYTTKNTVELVRGGKPYFDLLEKLIDEAKKTIHFQIYIYEADETGTRITNALIRAAQRGVTVYMLLDGYASRQLPSEMIQDLRKAGIHFRWFEPLFKSRTFYVGRRMHHKVVVADMLHSLVGGMNISNRYNDMPGEPAWLDWAAYATGEVSTELYNRCIQMWYRRSARAFFSTARNPFNGGQDCFVRVRINDWVRNKNQISRSYLQMFRSAQSQITIMSSYFLPGRIFRKNLRLAAQRGVKVRIILTKISDITLAKMAERFFYPWLLRRNIEIYEYKRKILHGKIATCDGQWVTVGSYNFNDVSAYASVELNLDVHYPAFSKQVDQALENIINIDCEQITMETLTRKTNIFHKMLYRLSYIIFRSGLFLFTFYFK